MTFANYFEVEGILDLAKYYKIRADEELHHSEWCVNYLSDADYKFTYPAIEINNPDTSNYIAPFIQTIDREIETTQMIYRIYEASMTEKDFMTASWLYEMLIKEQIEEENTSRMARTIMEESSDIFIRANKVYKLLK
jgi:ferritin